MNDLNAYGVTLLTQDNKQKLATQLADIVKTEGDDIVVAVLEDEIDGELSLCSLAIEAFQRGGYTWVYFLPYHLSDMLE